MITEFDASKFPKVKRFGLPIFPQDLLRQHLEYLDGHLSLKILKKPEEALDKLMIALMRPQILVNEIGKKITILIREILEDRIEV